MTVTFFFICLPIIAFLYSAVGHGGASGYLALMSIFSFAAADVKTIALTLNLFVAGIAFIQYYRADHFDKKLFFSLAITSIPAAYLGGRLMLDSHLYFYALGVFLLLAGLKLFFTKPKQTNNEEKNFSMPIVLFLGAIIGFISGLLGIGGGIILTPIILLLGWRKAKTTAGISALFIFVNSASGLLGNFSTGFNYPDSMPQIIVLVVAGGILGAYFGARKWSNLYIKKVLAIVLLLAAIKIFLT